jgi:serine phosphatase RsbU (regulator of sigma subunit)
MQGDLSHRARFAVVCAAALAVLVVWLATPRGANLGIAFFYTVPVALAAWWGGVRSGLLAVAGCTALFVLGEAFQPVPEFGVVLGIRLATFLGVALVAAFAGERLRRLEHSAEELDAIRAALTPARLPETLDVDVAAAFVPSELGVSGDFYLVATGPDGATVAVVGDVVGHGPKAARLATFVRARLEALAASTSDPAELLTLANAALADRPRRGRQLASAICVRYSPGESRLTWASAGHPPPLALPGLDEMAIEGRTFLLGAGADLELRNASVALEPGAGVLVYTDGATDVRRDGSLLGLDGLTRLLDPLAGLPARELADRAEQAILAWADGAIRDDLCLLALRPAGSGS